MNRTKRLVVIAGIGTALAGGLVAPLAAWAAEPAPTSSPDTATTDPGARPGIERPGIERPGIERPGIERPGIERQGLRGGHGQMAAKLAELLGLDEDKVAAALEGLRPSAGTGRPSGEGREAARQEMIEALAARLGVTADKLAAAMDTLRSQRAAEAESALSKRLKTAVAGGTLTRAEADAVLKAHRAGLLGGGHRGGGEDAGRSSGQQS
ncbi:hypothetical protein HS041_32490 [Planomonospora sp. ID67723]|uniref:hypothetical protein n=1 Tax=Planomonospora sp. ID67723 TaxID=2738134 RepID=UPI0018C449C0|nr:hypothetical protein [Planomonospora sp. ID67723]MBG0832426.1 hypothetical protein [Planomonospora sp. ID67723]